MPEPFISTQDIVSHIGRGGTLDPGMTQAADAACDWVRSITGRTVNQTSGTIVLDGSGTDSLLLPDLPVTAASAVVVNGVAVSDYRLASNGVLYRGTAGAAPADAPVWPEGRQNIQVTATWGWADNDIPRDLRMVALELASRLVLQGPAIQETIGQVSVRYGTNASDLTDGELRILRGYRTNR